MIGQKGPEHKGTKPSPTSAPAFEHRRQRFPAGAPIRKTLDHLFLPPHVVHQFDRPLATNLRIYRIRIWEIPANDRPEVPMGEGSIPSDDPPVFKLRTQEPPYPAVVVHPTKTVLSAPPFYLSTPIPPGQSQGSRIRVRVLDQACSGKQVRNLGHELGRTERLEDKVVGASSQALWRTIHARSHHNQYAL